MCAVCVIYNNQCLLIVVLRVKITHCTVLHVGFVNITSNLFIIYRAGRFELIRRANRFDSSESKLIELRFTNLEKQPSSMSKVAQH